MQLVAVIALGLVSGLLIGCVGIGGVILVPALVFMGDIPIQRAIPAALLAYIVSGVWSRPPFSRSKNPFVGAWRCRYAWGLVLRHSPVLGLLKTPTLDCWKRRSVC